MPIAVVKLASVKAIEVTRVGSNVVNLCPTQMCLLVRCPASKSSKMRSLRFSYFFGLVHLLQTHITLHRLSNFSVFVFLCAHRTEKSFI